MEICIVAQVFVLNRITKMHGISKFYFILFFDLKISLFWRMGKEFVLLKFCWGYLSKCLSILQVSMEMFGSVLHEFTECKNVYMSVWNAGMLGMWIQVFTMARSFSQIFRKCQVGISNIIC